MILLNCWCGFKNYTEIDIFSISNSSINATAILIARKDGVLCFVEVKTRTNLSCGLPREYVTPQKQERLRKTAAWYLMVKDLDCPARFDVAEVYAEGPHPQKASRIEYIENAF